MRTLWLIFLFWMSFVQNLKYPYQNYGDRREGIVPKRRLVAGERLDLIAAQIENLERVPTGLTPNRYKLGFYLIDSTRLKIEVREFEHSYKMQPTREIYPPGLNVFAWPSEIPMYYGIVLANLLPISVDRKPEGNTIVPIILYYNRPYNSEMRYIFSFEAYKPISVLEYKIVDTHERLIFTKRLQDLREIIHLHWNGRDLNNVPVASGVLRLNVRACFRPPPGASVSPCITLNYKFYHVPDLLRQEFRVVN